MCEEIHPATVPSSGSKGRVFGHCFESMVHLLGRAKVWGGALGDWIGLGEPFQVLCQASKPFCDGVFGGLESEDRSAQGRLDLFGEGQPAGHVH